MTRTLARIMIRLGINLNWLDPVTAWRRRDPIRRK
jgi:hypothetical protein